MIYTSTSAEDTVRIAAEFSESLHVPTLLCLYGDLGMGKSVFARSLIRSLCRDMVLEVPSPTFTLVQSYEVLRGSVYHLDLYRLGEPEEIFELGWDEMLHEGIVIVEWPERLGRLLPQSRIDIMIKSGDQGPDSRVIKIKKI